MGVMRTAKILIPIIVMDKNLMSQKLMEALLILMSITQMGLIQKLVATVANQMELMQMVIVQMEFALMAEPV